IVPAYFLAIFARRGQALADPAEVLQSLGAGLLLLPSRLSADGSWEAQALFPLNTPAGSLMLEAGANLAYAVFLPWLSRRALVFIVLASGLALVAAQVRLHGLDLGWGWPSLWGGPPRVTFSFFLGVLIHRARIRPPAIPRLLLLAAAPLLF